MSKGKQESLFWGVVLLIIGVLILLSNLGVAINWHFVGKFWPVIIIAIGAKYVWRHIESKKNQQEIE